MKKITFILLILLSIISCSETEKLKTPSNTIDKDVFTNIIYEVSLLEGRISSYNLNQLIYKDSTSKMYRGIFEKYNISAIDFKENNEYYILTDQYIDISKNVLKKIEFEQEKYKNIKPFSQISRVQFNQLFKKDKLDLFLEEENEMLRTEKFDSISRYYRVNSKRLDELNIDSLNFELNIKKLKTNKNLYNNIFEKQEVSVLKNINNE